MIQRARVYALLARVWGFTAGPVTNPMLKYMLYMHYVCDA